MPVILPGSFGAAASNANLYKAAVIADGPVNYFRLQETSGVIAADDAPAPVGGGGAYNGTVTLDQAGPFGQKSVSFTEDAFLGHGNTNTYITPGITMELWLNAGAQVNTDCHLMNHNNYFSPTFSNFPIALRYQNDVQDNIQMHLSQGDDFVADAILGSSGLSPVNPGTWYYVVGVYRDSGLCELYIDGSQVDSTNIGFTISSVTGGIGWATGRAAGEFGGGIGISGFVGNFCEVAHYNFALSSAQIANHWAKSGL